MNLSRRVLEGELMDAPDLSVELHQQALRGLQRVNWFSGTASTLASGIVQALETQNRGGSTQDPSKIPPGRSALLHNTPALRILDIACGGGDVTSQLASRLKKKGVRCSVQGWDRSTTAIDVARSRFESNDPDCHVSFEVRDAFSVQASDNFDIVTCTLFLHHLEDSQASEFLRLAFHAAQRLVIIDDLRRTQFGLRLAQLGCYALSRSPIVHVDGPLSVRAAFREDELIALTQSAGLPTGHWRRHWPQRFLMWWMRS